MASSHDYERRRFTSAELLQMLEAGIVHEDEPLELIDGELVMMSPQGPSHRTLTVRLRNRLMIAYGESMHVQDHSPIELAPNSMPEPDVAVIRGVPDAFGERLPCAADVVLVLEISVTTLAADRAKVALYARAGIENYWIINVAERRLETYAQPSGTGYGRVLLLAEDQEVALPGLSVTWPVRELFLPKP